MKRSGNQASFTPPVSSPLPAPTAPMRQQPVTRTPASQERQALPQPETELRNLAEQVPVALHHLDLDGTIIWANPAELSLLGYDAAGYVGQPIASVHVDPSVSDSIMDRLRRGEAVRDQPARIWCRDGSIRQVVISSIDTGVPDRFCCMMVDVTGQMIATEATARLAAIVDSSDDAIVGKLLDGTVTSWNRAAERLFGWRAEEMVGNSISRIVPPERRDDLASILSRLGRGEKIDHHETIRMRADGSRIDVSISVSPIYDQQGTIIGVAKIARDISERKAAERRRQELLEVVAHDLRTPLTTVLGYAQLLQRRLGDDVALKAIATQAGRMGRLLADVLETTRLESGRQYLRRAPFDLGELARESALNGSALSGNPSIRVVLPPEPVIGEWDIDRVSQILVNLLDNAAKYAPGSETVIEVSRVGDEAWLAVRDQGPGISLADRERIFERFYQGGSGQLAGGGVGLGLFISRALAEMHGGRLWVESEPGQGTVFTLALPLAPAETLAATPNGADPTSAVPEPPIQPPGANAAR
jgi:PAS domain S-box-containing protein